MLRAEQFFFILYVGQKQCVNYLNNQKLVEIRKTFRIKIADKYIDIILWIVNHTFN